MLFMTIIILTDILSTVILTRCLLEEGGHIFPVKIVVYGMLVESDILLRESAVQGQEPTLGFNIAPFINQFTVSTPTHSSYFFIIIVFTL